MGCCLMAPQHYLNQCWLKIISIYLSVISQECTKICWENLSFHFGFLKMFMPLPGDNTRHWINHRYTICLCREFEFLIPYAHQSPSISSHSDNKGLLSQKAATKWLTFCTQHFQMHFVEWKVLYFDSNLNELGSRGFNWDNWFMGWLHVKKMQAITQTNDNEIPLWYMVSLGHEEF